MQNSFLQFCVCNSSIISLCIFCFKICAFLGVWQQVYQDSRCDRVTQLRHLNTPFFWMPLLDLIIPHFDLAQNRASESQVAEPQAASESSEDSRQVKRRRQTTAARLKRWQNQCAVRLRKEIVPQPSNSEDPLPRISAELAPFLTPQWKTCMQTEPQKRRRQQSRALWSYLNHGCIRLSHTHAKSCVRFVFGRFLCFVCVLCIIVSLY